MIDVKKALEHFENEKTKRKPIKVFYVYNSKVGEALLVAFKVVKSAA